MFNHTQQRRVLIQQLRAAGIHHQAVLDAMMAVPRHLFIEAGLEQTAYYDTALPIGAGQTISQPYIVAHMTQALVEDKQPSRVLEVGTGSGYQAAVLAQLIPEVFTIERIRALYRQAQQRLLQHAPSVQCLYGDGQEGWPEHAPYDGIMITAATPTVPQALCDQLAEGGRLVAPVGEQGVQTLILMERNGDAFNTQVLEQVLFVPLLSGTD